MDDPKRIANQVADAYMAAAAALDVDGFISLYDPGARVFDLWTTWSYDGSTAWRRAVEALDNQPGGPFGRIRPDDERTILPLPLLVGRSLAVIRHPLLAWPAELGLVPLPQSLQHADGRVMLILSDWAQRIVTLRPVDATALAALLQCNFSARENDKGPRRVCRRACPGTRR